MFSFFKNKSSVFLILVITFSISLSSFSNTFTALSSALFNAPKASAQLESSSSIISSSSISSSSFGKSDFTIRTQGGQIESSSSSGLSTNYYYNSNNGQTYYCTGGSYDNQIFGNYFYEAIVGAFCNIYWSGYFYPTGPINYYPPVSSISSSSYVYNPSSIGYSSAIQEPVYTSSSIQGPVSLIPFETKSSIVSSNVAVSSVANNPSSYSIIPNCPVAVNSSLNYYGGGQISLQNNSPYTSNNLSANINLPTGVTVYGLEKGYNFYQNGNNLNISFPEVGPYSEISTSYTTNYNGADYNSSAVINCNQVTTPPVSSVIASSSSAINVASATQASSSRTRDQGTRDERCENNDRRNECNRECRNQNRDARNRNNESNGERDKRERRERNCQSSSLSSVAVISSYSAAALPDCPEEAFPDENSCYCPAPKTITFDPTPVGGNDHSHYCKLLEVTPQGLPICDNEVVFDINSCICPEPRQFADTSVEADHYHICKIPEPVTSSSSSSLTQEVSSTSSSSSVEAFSSSTSVSSTREPFCESANLILSEDKKLCICPIIGELIYIEKDANGNEESICRATSPKSVTSSSSSSILISTSISSSSSSISSTGFKGCEDSDLVLTDDGKFCKCPTAGELIYIVKDANGKEDSVCRATPPEVDTSSISSVSSSSSSSFISSSSIEVAPLLSAGSGGGVITIGGIGGAGENSTSVQSSSQAANAPARLSGQLSARDVPSNCEESVKVNGICPSSGTLDARQTPATTYDMFSIDDPYTCGGNFKGKIMNTSSKTVKYEFFKNGSSKASFSYDVPVKTDDTFELVIDYSIIPEDTYKIVYSAISNTGVVVSNSIEEFVTNNCSGANALAYLANKTIRTGGQGLTPIFMVVFGVLTLVGAIKFVLSKPRMN
jgi:hypothetical protein